MAAAHGFTMVTGRPQVVLVHVDVGTQQIGGALHNAQRGRIPVILCAGRTPATSIDHRRGGRNHRIHWLQEQYDQTGIVRNYTKWEYEIRHNDNIHHILARAFQMACTEPCGPVYLSFDREIIMEQMDEVIVPSMNRYPPPTTPQADTATLNQIADIIMDAKSPLICSGYSGRNRHSVQSLVELAELLGARVIPTDLRMNFPSAHPLCAGIYTVNTFGNPEPFLSQADVILTIDNDIPYLPSQDGSRPEAKIIHIDIDPVKKDIPLWDLPIDILVEADSSKAIPKLNTIIQEKMTEKDRKRYQERTKGLKVEHQQLRAQWHAMAMAYAEDKTISPEWLCRCINEAVDQDSIILNDVISDAMPIGRQLHRTKPGTLFSSGGSSLGWGLGAALGAKLAAPDVSVVSLIGDGGFVFGCPTAALWAAGTFNAPFLTIIFNNRAYMALKGAIKATYNSQCFSDKTGSWEGVEISPPPDYALIAKACQGYGRTVGDPSELETALKDALDQVRNGIPAVLDVWVEP